MKITIIIYLLIEIDELTFGNEPDQIINYSNVLDLRLKSDSNQNNPHMCHV